MLAMVIGPPRGRATAARVTIRPALIIHKLRDGPARDATAMIKGSSTRRAAHPIHPLFVDRWSARAMSGEPLTPAELMPLFEALRAGRPRRTISSRGACCTHCAARRTGSVSSTCSIPATRYGRSAAVPQRCSSRATTRPANPARHTRTMPARPGSVSRCRLSPTGRRARAAGLRLRTRAHQLCGAGGVQRRGDGGGGPPG